VFGTDDCLQHTCHGDRRLCSKFVSELDGSLFQFGDGVQFMDEANRQRGRPVDLPRAQDHVEGLRTSDGASEPRRSSPRGHRAEVELREADAGTLRGGEPEVAREWEFETATQALAEHGDHHRLVELLDHLQNP